MELLRYDFDVDNPQIAALLWARIAEPADAIAGAVTEHLGLSDALHWVLSNKAGSLKGSNLGHGRTALPNAALPNAALPNTAQSNAALPNAAPNFSAKASLHAAVETWRMRLDGYNPQADLQATQALGAELICRGDPHWPTQLADLNEAEPYALWVLGNPALPLLTNRAVALVGARAASAYGEQVATDFAGGLSDREFTVVSGGAYGIDAGAHRGALAAGGSTIALMAGGIDRLYPPGNHSLLKAISQAQNCAVIAELPPGSVPYRSRFLARNRLIAALSQATVVVEAAWRSGALSTARQAAQLFRGLGAVPGPITSMASAGCHGLMRDGIAVCVTDVPEVVELASTVSQISAQSSKAANSDNDGIARHKNSGDDRQLSLFADSTLKDQGVKVQGAKVQGSKAQGIKTKGPVARSLTARTLLDGLAVEVQHVYETLPAKNPMEMSNLVSAVALPLPSVLSALAVLEGRGLVAQSASKWRRVKLPN